MRLNIRVTKADIARGLKQNIHYCPIAMATKRCLREMGYRPGAAEVKIADDIQWNRYNGDLYGNMPNKASDFIDNFDGGNPVKPFNFTTYLREE